MEDKKQKLIEQITKMLEPYENIESYTFKMNLYFKNEKTLSDCVQISFNDYSVTPYAQGPFI
jgi:hypothetical protein